MARRKTIAELEETIKHLEPYREAFFALRRGSEEVTITSGEASITCIALERACGGVVIAINGEECGVSYLSDHIARLSRGYDPYLREIASKAVKEQIKGLERRDAAKRK